MFLIYFAHSQNEQGEKHDLIEHLHSTAELAEMFANVIGIKQVAFLAGLFHDFGKFHPSFQDYLEHPELPREVRDHSSAGAVYSLKFSSIGPIISWIIAGHHSGLSHRADLQNRLQKKQKDPDVLTAIELGINALQERKMDVNVSDFSLSEQWKYIEKDPASMEVWLRMLFSCVVDADFLDTESHFSSHKQNLRKTWQTDLEKLWEKFEEFQLKLQKDAALTPLNQARDSIFQDCLKGASHQPGLFKLNVPTGMGKTLSGMGFSLRHAILHKKKRIIVVVPYTSIIDQNSRVYEDIFGEENILQHHSAVDINFNTENEERRKLAAENWDAPIIVTTTVQFFESLFAHKTSSVRKIHNISNSVVILDEFQMLPLELLQSIFSMISELTLHYGVTFLLSSATPLALDFQEDHSKLKLPPAIDIVQDSQQLFERFQRVFYELPALDGEWSWDETAKEIAKYDQVMVIVNRRKDAVALFDLVKHGKKTDYLFHLSGLMCGAHRKKTLETVKIRLERQLPVCLIATQVVEAGVDIDFPVVMRALGPLDRIVQAAGRCNREGELRDKNGQLQKGKVIVFKPEQGGVPKGNYRVATKDAENLLPQVANRLYDPLVYEKYFKRLYGDVDIDVKRVEELRRDKSSPMNFPEISRRFKMIDANTVSVVVAYGEGKQLLEKVAEGKGLDRDWMREAQSFVVNLYYQDEVFLKQPESLRMLAEGWYEWIGKYDDLKGLVSGMDYEPADLTVS